MQGGAEGGGVAGLSTLLTEPSLFPALEFFTHFTDFIAKANSYCCSFRVHFPMPVVKVQHYLISTGTSNAFVLNVRAFLNFDLWHWVVHTEQYWFLQQVRKMRENSSSRNGDSSVSKECTQACNPPTPLSPALQLRIRYTLL